MSQGWPGGRETERAVSGATIIWAIKKTENGREAVPQICKAWTLDCSSSFCKDSVILECLHVRGRGEGWQLYLKWHVIFSTDSWHFTVRHHLISDCWVILIMTWGALRNKVSAGGQSNTKKFLTPQAVIRSKPSPLLPKIEPIVIHRPSQLQNHNFHKWVKTHSFVSVNHQ